MKADYAVDADKWFDSGYFSRRPKHSDFSIGMLSFSEKQDVSYMLIDENQILRVTPKEYDDMDLKNKNSSGMHSHDYFELLYILEGEMKERFEDETLTLKQGEATLLNKNIRHSESVNSSSFSAVYLCISDFFARQLLQYEKNDEPSIILDFLSRHLEHISSVNGAYCHFGSKKASLNSGPFQEIADKIVTEMTSKKIGYQYICLGYLRRIFSLLDSQYDYNQHSVYKISTGDKTTIDRIALYIDEYLGNISKHDLAKLLGYNTEYLCKFIKKYFNMSYTHYCLIVRLKYAAAMLDKTDLPATVISEKLGFSNRTYFYRAFEKQYTFTPQEYRNRHGNMNY